MSLGAEGVGDVPSRALRVVAYRTGLVVSALLVVATVAMLPFAIDSIVHSVSAGRGSSDVVWSAADLSGEWTKINLSASNLDVVDREVTFAVSGFHDCPGGCAADEGVQFFAIRSDPDGSLGPPPSAMVALPADSSDVDTSITLPVSGDLTAYPFDHYRIDLGISLVSVGPHGADVPVSAAKVRRGLAFSVDDAVARTTLATPRVLDASRLSTRTTSYDAVVSLTFGRPTYLWMITILLIMLIILAEAYAVLMRPFNQIIPTIGGLVLGVWGVRTLLVGSYPPDSTGVDLVLEGTILLLLLAFAVRAVHYLWTAGRDAARGAPPPE